MHKTVTAKNGLHKAICLILLCLSISGCHSGSAVSEGRPFLRAIENGDVARVRAMLEKNPELIATTSGIFDGLETPAIEVASHDAARNNVELVRLLLQAGANPNSCRRWPNPLAGQKLEVMRLLLDAGVAQRFKDEALLDDLAEYNSLAIALNMYIKQSPAWRKELDELQSRIALLRASGAGADNSSPTWRGPSTLAWSRLQAATGWMDIWNSPDGPRWVQFRLIQSGSSMNVLVLDQNRNIVRTGNATGPGSFTPYTLVEVRSHSEKIPSESRGRWMLAVACWKAPLDVGAPIRFTASPAARS